MTSRLNIAELEERTRAILAVNPNYRPHYYVPPHEVMALIAALREAKGALERIKGEVANGNMRFEADTTLRSIAAKVEGL